MRERKNLRLSPGIAKALADQSARTGQTESEIADIALAEYFSREAQGVLKEYAEMIKRQSTRELHQALQVEHANGLFHVSRIEESVLQMAGERTISSDEIATYLRNEINGLAEHLHPSRVQASQAELGRYLVMLDKGSKELFLKALRSSLRERRDNLREFLKPWPSRSSTPRLE